MEIVNFPESRYANLGAQGKCPHCSVISLFLPLAMHIDDQPTLGMLRGASIAYCQSCKKEILVLGWRKSNGTPFYLDAVYPAGAPDDKTASEIPDDVAADFAEALRCEWIRARKACVVMCRRALQASAIELGARGSKLVNQIDDLFASGKITEALKDFAHEVRLSGNTGAHPDEDGLEDVTDADAKEILEFTREFMHHVYVMPAKLKARRASAAADQSKAKTNLPKRAS